MAIDIYVTCTDKTEATRISKHLLKLKLIACANIFPVDSLYWWKGKIVKGKEAAVLIKAQEKNYSRIEKEIKKLHSYTVPCISLIKIAKINKECEKWLKGVTK